MTGNIFSKYPLEYFIRNLRNELSSEIDSLSITESTNLTQLIQELTTKYTIAPLTLKAAKPKDIIETTRDEPDGWGGKYRVKCSEIKIEIEFEGNRQLFDCRPTTSTIINLDDSVCIGTSIITATIVIREDSFSEAQYNGQVNRIISNLSTNIPRVNSEIAPWNNGLENHIKELITQRKLITAKKHDFMEKIGLKVNPRSNEFMIPPPVAKKIIPTPVSETTEIFKKELIPSLENEVYRDIIEVLYNVGKAIERKPSLYLNKHEPDIRDLFLLFLETRYESTTGVGEAFNKKGKTDILLKYANDGTNIFVAECKFWKGQGEVLDDIDQLLGYLTHRDSKTALMIFVDQMEFTSIIQKLRNEIQKHNQFIRFVRDTYNTSINYEFSLQSDSKAIIQIEVMFFHFPKDAKSTKNS